MRKWTRQRIISEIVHLFETGSDLSYSAALADHTALFRAAVRQFGSWSAAVSDSGMPYAVVGRRRKWTRDEIVADIWSHAQAGADLSWSTMHTLDPPLVSAARKPGMFGSWQRALEFAGVSSPSARRHRSWDDDTILAAIRRLCELGSSLRACDVAVIDPALLAAARRRFGSWRNALRKAERRS